jgi:PEP-CTERM motif
MRKKQLIVLVALAGLLCCIRPAFADQISTTIGNPGNFVAGQVVGVSTFNSTVAGQPAPFNAFIGSNATGPNFSASWTFSYTLPVSSTITGATLTIGILDSPWQGRAGNSTPPNTNQVASFTLDGTVSLAGLLNTEINSVGTGINKYEVDTISIPGADLSALASGSATFALALQGPGNGVLGPTSFLGAGLDFSTLDITVTPSSGGGSPVPEPSTLTLLAAGLIGLRSLISRR